jgi:hypothetical protein
MSEHRTSAARRVVVVPLRERRPTGEEDNALTWQWMMAQLHDEAHQIRAALDEHAELGNPDWTAALSLWSLQFTGMQLAAAATPDQAQRARLEALLAERKQAMNAILARIRRMQRKAS